MSTYIYNEMVLFLKAAGTGAFFLFFYEGICGFREAMLRKQRNSGPGDIFFWFFCAFWIFRFAEKENYGEIRGFLVAGILIGAWGSWYFWHQYLMSIWGWFWKLIVKFVKKMRKRLLFPIKQCKIFMYQFAKLVERGENQFRKLKRGSKSEK